MLTKLVPFMYFIVHLLFHNKKNLLKIKCYFKINFLNFKLNLKHLKISLKVVLIFTLAASSLRQRPWFIPIWGPFPS